MPPSAESSIDMCTVESAPQKNVTYAVNYEVSLVDEFVASQRKTRVTGSVDKLPASTAEASSPTVGKNLENSAPNVPKDNAPPKQVTVQSPPPTQNEKTARRSARDKNKRPNLAKARVRYDMQVVPPARRHRPFLQAYPAWWLQDQQQQSLKEENFPPCDHCDAETPPFAEDTSVLWVPSKRTEWEDTVSEMTAVCTSAALRRHLASTSNKPFHPPLSRDYIRDRVDIDDPLCGYQIRHKAGGWLQGFVLYTNFTTWTHYFRWDSLHEASGMKRNTDQKAADADGSLAKELEALTRSGDPHGGGIVFPEIAEIALLGGLGCGEYLLRMALESIRAKKQYNYVVLQATDSSKTFYERFGFVRVGAVCRYTEKDTSPLVGYRHWTHANESETSLEMHGGPSYMMCLKLPRQHEDGCPSCGRPAEERKQPSFLDAMLQLVVEDKPTIEQLGAASTPAPKTFRRSGSLPAAASSESLFPSTDKKMPGRRSSSVQQRRKSTSHTLHVHPGMKRSLSSCTDTEPSAKRRKPNGAVEGIPREELLSPPGDGKSLSYAQKQYHSVWLAVPPTESKPYRPPPKRRASVSGPVKKTPRQKRRNSSKSPKTVHSRFVDGKERFYHSVRGPDGRFIRVECAQPGTRTTAPAALKPPAKPAPKAPAKPAPVGKPAARAPVSRKGIANRKAVDRKGLMKQKVRSYPRSRLHYYNRVVKKMNGSKHYYFVLNYDESKGTIRIVPMMARGTLTGKREGRPRYQCKVGDTDSNFQTVTASEYQVVPAVMVMKTPYVALEAWDIEDD